MEIGSVTNYHFFAFIYFRPSIPVWGELVLFEADVMRLVVEAPPVIIENGLSTGGTISTDDNSNNTLSGGKKSLTQCNEKWAWNGSLNKEEEINNYNNCNKNQSINLNSNQDSYNPAKLQPLDLRRESAQNHLETPSPANSSPSEGESSCCESSDSEEDKPTLTRKSFANPNYPGFQHLAHELNDNFNNNINVEPPQLINNVNCSKNAKKEIDEVNKLNPQEGPKEIYCRPKLNIPLE
ncbi:hypothetical protein GE061_010127, partial [Apolygus lucorum]